MSEPNNDDKGASLAIDAMMRQTFMITILEAEVSVHRALLSEPRQYITQSEILTRTSAIANLRFADLADHFPPQYASRFGQMLSQWKQKNKIG